jgi:formylglycine-generating enzyme required for sulfatase activity
LAETSTPAAGAIRWNGLGFEGYNGIAWIPLSGSILVAPEMVTVGNPGNADDPGGNGLSGLDTHSGAVAYTYKIGKFEVTNAEYTQFLNAVDSGGGNALDLYDLSMNNESRGGISNDSSGAMGGKYVVKPGRSEKPVVFVTFYDALRFCNWLHNGAIEDGDTENGAYTLLGGAAVPSNGTTVQRNAGAKFALPNEDEWYKAAYYEPGGDADDYWLYPTRGNSAPNISSPPGIAPAANYSLPVVNVTDVGAYNTTEGFYGTFDMAGNVGEWTETMDTSSRVMRGGGWGINANLQATNAVLLPPGNALNVVGFRISSP